MQFQLRSATAIACALLLSGCFESINQALNPPPPPTGSQIAASFTSFENGWNQVSTALSNSVPSGVDLNTYTAQVVLAFGYDLTKRNCDNFFRQNRNLRNETGLAKDTLVSVSAASGLIAGISGVTATVLTGFLGATGIIPGLINNFDKSFLLSDIADSIYGPVMSGLDSYSNANPYTNATKLNVIGRLTEYSRICSVSFMLDLAKKGIANTTVTAAGDNATVQNTPATTTDSKVSDTTGKKGGAPPVTPAATSKTLGSNGSLTIQSIK